MTDFHFCEANVNGLYTITCYSPSGKTHVYYKDVCESVKAIFSGWHSQHMTSGRRVTWTITSPQKVLIAPFGQHWCEFAIDEAHLISEWSDFRKAYTSLETLHTSFRNTPIMALTATATPKVEDDIRKLLRNPIVSKSSINGTNITLSATELVIPSK